MKPPLFDLERLPLGTRRPFIIFQERLTGFVARCYHSGFRDVIHAQFSFIHGDDGDALDFCREMEVLTVRLDKMTLDRPEYFGQVLRGFVWARMNETRPMDDKWMERHRKKSFGRTMYQLAECLNESFYYSNRGSARYAGGLIDSFWTAAYIWHTHIRRDCSE